MSSLLMVPELFASRVVTVSVTSRVCLFLVLVYKYSVQINKRTFGSLLGKRSEIVR